MMHALNTRHAQPGGLFHQQASGILVNLFSVKKKNSNIENKVDDYFESLFRIYSLGVSAMLTP